MADAYPPCTWRGAARLADTCAGDVMRAWHSAGVVWLGVIPLVGWAQLPPGLAGDGKAVGEVVRQAPGLTTPAVSPPAELKALRDENALLRRKVELLEKKVELLQGRIRELEGAR